MTMTVLDRAPATGDAGRVTGERRDRPDPEVPERARRRTFTAQYKLDILAAYDAAGPTPVAANETTRSHGPRRRASGSMNRSSSPDSVRYMSVTTAAQRRLLTEDDTP
jgi:hypothetical protein